ncbi:M domain protein [Desulfosporosinus sp.]|uniref:M domain protein n=1 Tax=Desulfosporosinus sp. TaxID=157907 RepID=UPI0025C1D7B6|nr:M domain protein [Desulfosporosinus sp.]MBC2721738.1 M domain protein [Desulfosporosinus sp.]MBC2726348.1 M domain protein [Desulfosporosinus sp.]
MEKESQRTLELILKKLNELDSKVDNLDFKVDNLDTRVNSLESKMDLRMDSLELRQNEIYLVVKAIEQNSQVHRDETDNLKYTVSNLEGTINTIGDVITKRKAI